MITMRLLRPSIIYKYKPASNKRELERLEEILVGKTIYFPTLKQLNDPMEACSAQFSLQIAGSGYHNQAGKVHPVIEYYQEKFGILSFTAIPNSPIMWAHYGKEYTGCCMIFSSVGTFSTIEPTIYSNIGFGYSAEDFTADELVEYVRESLFYKDTDWAYENEWRFIKDRETDKIVFGKQDLIGVIVGERMEPDRQKWIASLCESEEIPCFKTYVMKANKTIGAIPIEYNHDFIVRSEINEYMETKKKEQACIGEEYKLFGILNSDIGWDE